VKILGIRTGNIRVKHGKSAALPGKILFFLALLLSVCSIGFAGPGGQHEEGLPGAPTLGDIFEFIDKNPEAATALIQDSGQWPYLTVAAGIIACHDAAIAGGGRPIPARLRKTLRRWYPDELLNAVRWTSLRESIRQLLQDGQMNFDGETLAITMMDVVIFRSDDLANDGALWAHELYHVQQYRKWGVFGFAKRWVDDASVSGPLEAPAYARQAEAEPFFTPR
jgi:hypothetical protein